MKITLSRIAVALAFAVATLVAPRADAQEAPVTTQPTTEPVTTAPAAPPDMSEQQLQFFRTAAEEEKSNRRLGNALGLAAGLVGGAASGILISDDGTSTYAYILTGISGLRVITAVVGLLSDRGPYDELAETVDGWRASGIAGEDLRLRLDRKWYQLAVDSRKSRVRRGVFGIVLGTVFAATAITLAASKNIDADVDTRARASTGYAAAAAGIFATAARTLALRDPIEVGYAASHSGAVPVTTKGVSLAPGSGGLFAFTF